MSEKYTSLADLKIGYAFCGSFCTFSRSIEQLKRLKEAGADVTAIMSFNASTLDTRFGTAESFRKTIEEITGKPIILTIEDAEPIGPKKMFDVLVICPCTGNTMAKLASRASKRFPSAEKVCTGANWKKISAMPAGK